MLEVCRSVMIGIGAPLFLPARYKLATVCWLEKHGNKPWVFCRILVEFLPDGSVKMTIAVSCTNCGAAYEMPDNLGGQIGQCTCGANFQIPHQLAAIAVAATVVGDESNPYAAPVADAVASGVPPTQHGLSSVEVSQIAKCRTGMSFLYASVILIIILFFGGVMVGIAGSNSPRELGGLVGVGLLGLVAFIFSLIGNGFLMSVPVRSTGQGLMKAAFGLQIGALVLSLFSNINAIEQLGRRANMASTDHLALTLVVLGMQLAYNVCWCLGMQRFFGFLNDPANSSRASLLLKMMVTVIGLAILSPVLGISSPAFMVIGGISIFVFGIITIVVYVRLIEQGRRTLRNITG